MSAEERAARAATVVSSPQRLATAREAGLFDTPAEEVFDSLSKLAVNLLGVPVSFLSIVDEKRDFYKSQCGMPEPLATSREMTESSFCHLALASDEPLVIEDTHSHPVWRQVSSVENFGVRSYIGVPLILDGQPIGSFCVVDMRPRSWTSVEIETLTQLAKSAAREIQLRGALDKAVVKAERANALAKANEELLAVVAHDLRSPLQIVGMSATLLAGLAGPDVLPHVKRIDNAVAAMKGLVEDLLATNAVSGRVLVANIPASRLIHDAAETMRMVAERAGISLSVASASDDAVRVDYGQLLRVLCNLIGNCIKYCPAGSTVVLSSLRAHDGVMLTVSDDGPGMSAEEQSLAFERGWQGNTALNRRDGAGLGLTIVRELVEQNGGRVSLSSALGKGTRVSVILPLL